ncbi:hypothetical protein DL95DRAFT_474015 [Leptodontidium sp. 2 PMI_412]|nr:hypothetical protein DL95DRAFT_474015 [Leptodontidium sp. 2 PMI_412]
MQLSCFSAIAHRPHGGMIGRTKSKGQSRGFLADRQTGGQDVGALETKLEEKLLQRISGLPRRELLADMQRTREQGNKGSYRAACCPAGSIDHEGREGGMGKGRVRAGGGNEDEQETTSSRSGSNLPSAISNLDGLRAFPPGDIQQRDAQADGGGAVEPCSAVVVATPAHNILVLGVLPEMDPTSLLCSARGYSTCSNWSLVG